GFTLVTLRSPIARRPALDDVRDINIFAPQAHRLDHIVEQLAGTAHEGLALLVFVSARRFADEHQLRPRIAHAENNLFPSLLGEATASAVADVFTDDTQPLGWIGKCQLGLGGNFEQLFLIGYDGSYGCRVGSRQWLSLFWLDLDGDLAPVKIIDAKFIVVADALGQRKLELWVQGSGHGNFKRLQISD